MFLKGCFNVNHFSTSFPFYRFRFPMRFNYTIRGQLSVSLFACPVCNLPILHPDNPVASFGNGGVMGDDDQRFPLLVA